MIGLSVAIRHHSLLRLPSAIRRDQNYGLAYSSTPLVPHAFLELMRATDIYLVHFGNGRQPGGNSLSSQIA